MIAGLSDTCGAAVHRAKASPRPASVFGPNRGKTMRPSAVPQPAVDEVELSFPKKSLHDRAQSRLGYRLREFSEIDFAARQCGRKGGEACASGARSIMSLRPLHCRSPAVLWARTKKLPDGPSSGKRSVCITVPPDGRVHDRQSSSAL